LLVITNAATTRNAIAPNRGRRGALKIKTKCPGGRSGSPALAKKMEPAGVGSTYRNPGYRRVAATKLPHLRCEQLPGRLTRPALEGVVYSLNPFASSETGKRTGHGMKRPRRQPQ
jgi:hypothetical protein